ncbi:hypothetical protein [Luteimonas yindakuii]|uniref:hypothetical protein n=1 Tax=Luteimonas yindakuii TaxID=2565782 RepID=UPI0031345BC2
MSTYAQLYAGGGQRLAQQREIAQPVAVVEEAGQAVVAALHDVLRYAGQVESWQTGHVMDRGRPLPVERSPPTVQCRRASGRSHVGKVDPTPFQTRRSTSKK